MLGHVETTCVALAPQLLPSTDLDFTSAALAPQYMRRHHPETWLPHSQLRSLADPVTILAGSRAWTRPSDCLAACCIDQSVVLCSAGAAGRNTVRMSVLPLAVALGTAAAEVVPEHRPVSVQLPGTILQLTLSSRLCAGWGTPQDPGALPLLAARTLHGVTCLKIREHPGEGGGLALQALGPVPLPTESADVAWSAHFAGRAFLMSADASLAELEAGPAGVRLLASGAGALLDPGRPVPRGSRGVLACRPTAHPRTALLAVLSSLQLRDLRERGPDPGPHPASPPLWACARGRVICALAGPQLLAIPGAPGEGVPPLEHLAALSTTGPEILLFDLRRPGTPVAAWPLPSQREVPTSLAFWKGGTQGPALHGSAARAGAVAAWRAAFEEEGAGRTLATGRAGLHAALPGAAFDPGDRVLTWRPVALESFAAVQPPAMLAQPGSAAALARAARAAAGLGGAVAAALGDRPSHRWRRQATRDGGPPAAERALLGHALLEADWRSGEGLAGGGALLACLTPLADLVLGRMDPTAGEGKGGEARPAVLWPAGWPEEGRRAEARTLDAPVPAMKGALVRDVPVELPIHLQVLRAAAAARPRRKQAATAGAKGSAAAATRRTRELLQVANLKVPITAAEMCSALDPHVGALCALPAGVHARAPGSGKPPGPPGAGQRSVVVPDPDRLRGFAEAWGLRRVCSLAELTRGAEEGAGAGPPAPAAGAEESLAAACGEATLRHGVPLPARARGVTGPPPLISHAQLAPRERAHAAVVAPPVEDWPPSLSRLPDEVLAAVAELKLSWPAW
ncbi:hypothetical protein ACKKBF_B20885 [Auxenochlorella protothecoides x Auxenochlorella symbiontica]